ncbi:glutamine-hydrolyzing carbamoyl-phosphate synthase small subunit [Psychroflexus aestuariivivens]|uniref:glutamine-hydrolyzing carbamoyl-phosphate synthase small subunit n=1 Tax=Psychroflexus aestuariivivens TaxID=1795040 RepID=UPI000FDB353F|nr:glutamine-hydrolyzing carbamoyl-phosphate synthase small subunit [Psychroflexus aestuariivivens]
MKYHKKVPAILILEDGTVFNGNTVGELTHDSVGEICFNTGMTGYQEIFSDPSYFGQIMVTTNAHIGNYGTNKDESESNSAKISGLVCKNFTYQPSRVNSDLSLEEFLTVNKISAICDIDTRALVSHIRKNGAMNAIISSDVENIKKLQIDLSNHPNMKGLELASKVSTVEPYFVGNENAKYKISVLDLGCKFNILRRLANRDAYIQVFPFDTSFEELTAWNPDGILISNGPGDPDPLSNAIEVARKCITNNIPTFGICLGHQIIALAKGIPTFKMHTGHRGINHPVQNLKTGKSEITSQNHGFSVDKSAAENHEDIEITHIHLNDDSVAGLKIKNKPCFSVQYHPEAGPGPNDATYLFDQFFDMIGQEKLTV